MGDSSYGGGPLPFCPGGRIVVVHRMVGLYVSSILQGVSGCYVFLCFMWPDAWIGVVGLWCPSLTKCEMCKLDFC